MYCINLGWYLVTQILYLELQNAFIRSETIKIFHECITALSKSKQSYSFKNKTKFFRNAASWQVNIMMLTIIFRNIVVKMFLCF